MQASAVPEIRKAAEDSFDSGLYCAESVVLAIAAKEGVNSELLPRLATAFCSGMARSSGTCGALTGAIMGISLALGRGTADESVQLCYTATQRLIREFEEAFRSRDCYVLLGGCDLNQPEGQALFKERKLGERCRHFTGKAAEIATQVIDDSRR